MKGRADWFGAFHGGFAALCVAVMFLTVPGDSRGQTGGVAPGTRAAWDSAWTAWDAGEFVVALETLDRILRAPGAEALIRPAALLTGEAWTTIELTRDGRAPRWSPDGRFVVYETGERAEPRTRVVSATDGGVRLEVDGSGAALAPDGSVLAWLGAEGEVLQRPVAAGEARRIETGGMAVRAIAWSDNGDLYAAAGEGGTGGAAHLLRLTGDGAPATLFTAPTGSTVGQLQALRGGRLLATLGRTAFAVIDPTTGQSFVLDGVSPAASADGRSVAFIEQDGGTNRLRLVSTATGESSTVREGTERLAAPALSPDGSRVAFQMMPREDWELYVVDPDGSGETRITRDIQHDLLPQFLNEDVLLAVMGEGRHRRSQLYDLRLAVQPDGAGQLSAADLLPGTPGRTRLFHNNTVRTVAPEYEWHVSPDASRILILAERDGDTVTPERGVYVTDLRTPVSRDQLLARIAGNLAAEKSLQAWGIQAFEPIRDDVERAVNSVQTGRIARYANDLYQFDSKHVTQPGNAKAIAYITARLREFGYEPELQWFTPPARRGRGATPPRQSQPGQPEIRTANIIATLPGTTNPELIYVVSSHFDSNARSPGADDDSSASTALLEAARVMAGYPQAATIQFAFFTGEESGLLGSREYVRRAVEAGDRIVGALNNDMVGYANNHRLDNTIRYSNDGIRDIQHAAAFLFTDLITYDARYYKSTDAQAYYDAYGDIVGGIGSYPILASPHYHQSHDVLETINQQLVAEVSKTTVATLMLMAASPARPTGLRTARSGAALEAAWEPAPERGVSGYIVAWGPDDDPLRNTSRTSEPRFEWRQAPPPGTVISIKATGYRGLPSWDWARTTLERPN